MSRLVSVVPSRLCRRLCRLCAFNRRAFMKRCALCDQEVDVLIESHLLPNAAFRAMREIDSEQKLLQLNFRDNTAYYHDKQIKTKLLCRRCEDLFSKRGERQAGMLWANRNGFRLLDILEATANCQPLNNGMNLYDGNILPAVVVDSIRYFFFSVFWRANVWPERLHTGYNGALGPYAQKIQAFLLDGEPVIEFKMIVQVNTNKDFHSLMRMPTLVSGNGVKTHYVTMQGLNVLLYLGQSAKSAGNLNIFSGFQSSIAFVTLDISTTTIITNMAERLPSIRSAGKLQLE